MYPSLSFNNLGRSHAALCVCVFFFFLCSLCEDRTSGQECALKCLPFNDSGLREARLHQQLTSHPNIVPVLAIYDATLSLPGGMCVCACACD